MSWINNLVFLTLSYTYKKKTTRKERFFERDGWGVCPGMPCCNRSCGTIPSRVKGVVPIPASVMLRIYFMQQWYGLSDPGMEDSPV